MKKLKLAVIAVFSLMILLPLVRFRLGEGIVSKIDNRKLQENPFYAKDQKKPMSDLLSAYVSDRLGFRDEMILAYQILNDKIFGELFHRSYRYGKDGYIFYRDMFTPVYGDYHESFADMIKQIQDYCEMRDVAFLFVFEPQKNNILPQYLPSGVHYDNRWVSEFFCALDARGVHYIDNTITMREKTAEGISVFNPKFDAGHWNDIGRFYGVNAILSELHKTFPGIKPNKIDDFEQSELLMTVLPVSRFPIHEYVPVIKVPLDDIEDKTKRYEEELERNRLFHVFGYTHNLLHSQDTPRTLFFQGSHLNSGGWNFLAYALGEYIYVHNYHNIIEFPYYYNIFHPKCVVFEVAENVLLSQGFFDINKMKKIHLNPPLGSIIETTNISAERNLTADEVSVHQGKILTKIVWKPMTDGVEYAWCILDNEYDMRPSVDSGYEVTVKNDVYEQYKKQLKIVVYAEKTLQVNKT